FLSNCESLVADGGAILVSSNQLKDKKIQDLPDHFIVFATTSQLVNSIGEGLRKINRQSNRNTRPTNITTINNFTLKQDTHFMTYGSTAKNLYLLLLEDL
ncbi:MAG TPA: LUD domain-containing protein, partial [Flavobacteriaceae bacterium]|nr:LUD domain-containing protein [Flavobacteriaceae bacterium]